MSDPTCRQTLAPHAPSCTAAPAALSSSSVFRIRDGAARLCEAQQAQVAPEGIADTVASAPGGLLAEPIEELLQFGVQAHRDGVRHRRARAGDLCLSLYRAESRLTP